MSHIPSKMVVAGCLIGLLSAGCVGSGDVQVPVPLVPLAMIAWAHYEPKVVATIGEPTSGDCYVHNVSDHFGKKDLRQLYDLLNAPSLQTALTNYSCGDPVPTFTFR